MSKEAKISEKLPEKLHKAQKGLWECHHKLVNSKESVD